MNPEYLSLVETARLLGLDTREVIRRARNEALPGQERGGRWVFRRADLRDFIQQALSGYTDAQLADLDQRIARLKGTRADLLVSPLLHRDAMALPLSGRSKASVLRELVGQGEQLDLVWDRDALLEAIEDRESRCATGVGAGVALPHPRQLAPYVVAESFIIFGRTETPIPYGSVDGSMVDLFFLVCSTDESIHLQVLARLCRLLRDAGVTEFLRNADSADAVVEFLTAREQRLLLGY